MAKTKSDPNYFRYPKPVEGILIAILMAVFYFCLYDPENAVLDYTGPLGTFGRYLNKNYYGLLKVILYISIAIHTGESVYAGSLCKKKGINTITTVKWMVQTFIMGFPSLLRLVAYKPNTKNT